MWLGKDGPEIVRPGRQDKRSEDDCYRDGRLTDRETRGRSGASGLEMIGGKKGCSELKRYNG